MVQSTSSVSTLSPALAGQDLPGSGPESSLVGVDPVGKVLLMENHDGAYHAWRQAGVRARIVLHIDAHIDWDWIKDEDPLKLLQGPTLQRVETMLEESSLWNLTGRKSEELVDLGNYLYPALRERMVREIFFVVPDAFLESSKMQRNILNMFRRMKSENPRGLLNIRLEENRVVAEIDGNRITTCSLSNLPQLQEPVLLDIDTDFLTTEAMGGGRPVSDPWRQLPWIWPEELIGRLKEREIRTDFVTIAYSVEGSYTPLIYKYLGDELALRLQCPVIPERDRELSALKRRGATFRADNALEEAIASFEAAVCLSPEDASSHFNLAYLYDQGGDFDRSAASYREAVRLDPSYRTAFNNFGFLYQVLGILDHAREEYQRILRWDPQHADAHAGLAEVLVDHEQWDDAIHHYRAALELRADHARAYRGLGHLYIRQGLWDQAITHLRRAVALLPHDGGAQCWLGEACRRQKRWEEAIQAYRAALRGGLPTIAIHARLAALYLKQRRFYKAWKQYRKVVQGWLRVFSTWEGFRTLVAKLAPRPRRVAVRH